jgi:hypothetical protein
MSATLLANVALAGTVTSGPILGPSRVPTVAWLLIETLVTAR